jgi:hypothetical protein
MSNRQPEENEKLLDSIISTIAVIRDEMVTKNDLERFATKEDLERFATKEDLKRFATKEDLERFATKDDLDSLREQVGYIGGQLETMRDQMATKSDIARLEDKIEVETTAIRGDIEQVHLRLDGIEKTLSSRLNHIEAEMSRLRSVVYLLVKDKPDMLRLLGQTPPTGG